MKPHQTITLIRWCCTILSLLISLSCVLVLADSGLIFPDDLTYIGAFRLPDGGMRPDTFEYSGNAMTFCPDKDGENLSHRFSGTLYISGHERTEDVRDGGKVAQISIPVPELSSHPAGLPEAEFIQRFSDVSGGFFDSYYTIPRMGLAYLDRSVTGPKIHLAWGDHFEPEVETATHSWFSPDLSDPNPKGSWFIDDISHYMVNGYLFEIPQEWADKYTGGRTLATGRFRDGGWSGMGPALFAYSPWTEGGYPAPAGSHVPALHLLQYRTSEETADIEGTIDGYQHPDEWEGGAFLTTSDGKHAVIFAGTKGIGDRYWYRWINPAEPSSPCPEMAYADEYTVCRRADGNVCPDSEMEECPIHNDYRGWWSSSFDAQIIFYDPDDLASVAMGTMESWKPQPYSVKSIDNFLFHNPDQIETEMIGIGDQRKARIGDIAYDRKNQILYILELYADGAKPVVHVFSVN